MGRARSKTLLVILIWMALLPAQAQFGQNKITYQDFDWQVYKSPHFDVHYYPEMEPFLEDVVSYAESAYLKLSRELDHELKVRVPLIVYNTHGEFQQTNITLAELPEAVGAFAEPVQYRMVLPIDQPPEKLYQLIAHELTHIFQYSMFFEGILGRALRSRPPGWLMEGMASYFAADEDNLDQMAIRDAVVNNILPPIQALDNVTFLTYRYGHAIFDYIEETHGMEGVRGFLFEFKKVMMTGNLAKAIKESFGYDIDEFNRRFNRYLRRKYFPVLLEKKSPDEYGTEVGIRKPGAFTFSPSISPSGELIAALSAPKMELDLVVLSAEDGSTIKNLTKGWTNDYRGLVSKAFSGKRDLSWSPTADRVAVFARREDKWPLLIYDAVSGKQLLDIPIIGIAQNSSPAFSTDGQRVAFEGNQGGVVDIFEIDLETREIRNLTGDDFFDANPWYSADGESLLYNRKIGSHWKIFSVDLEDSTKKTQLTFGQFSDIQPAYARDGKSVFFSSDRGGYGVFNIHELDLETGNLLQYTDVVGGTFAPQEMAERNGEQFIVFQAYFEGTFRLYRMPLRDPELTVDATDRLADPNEAEPFEPPLRLRTDDSQKSRYKLKWDIEAPSIEIGVANDGTILGSGAIQFTDLLGNHRIFVGANTVADFASFSASYINLKRRYNWGASLTDFRDFFLTTSGSSVERRNEYRLTGGEAFIQYPLNRYYRLEGSAGLSDTSQAAPTLAPDGSTQLGQISNTIGTLEAAITGDTTRYQSFGPFQGKRFRFSTFYGPYIAGDDVGDWLEYRMDFRAYRQLTRRSLIAWRLSGVINGAERELVYGFGGVNQLRGYEFREFNGSNLAWSNLEFRFPLVDRLDFPVLRLVQIRGFVFLDVGAAWFNEDVWYDPNFGGVENVGALRIDPATGQPVPFRFWDSDNNRLQDGRASYGFGFQFFFIGGLQFNWAWSHRLDYTQFTCVPQIDPGTGAVISPCVTLEKQPADTGGTQLVFYIVFDF